MEEIKESKNLLAVKQNEAIKRENDAMAAANFELVRAHAREQFDEALKKQAQAVQTYDWIYAFFNKVNKRENRFFTFTKKHESFAERKEEGTLPEYDVAIIVVATKNILPTDIGTIMGEGEKVLKLKNSKAKVETWFSTNYCYKAGQNNAASDTSNANLVEIVKNLYLHVSKQMNAHKMDIVERYPKHTDKNIASANWYNHPKIDHFRALISDSIAEYWTNGKNQI